VTMFWMLPQAAQLEHEGNPESPDSEFFGHSGLAPDERLATYGGRTNRLDDAWPWRLRGSWGAERSLNSEGLAALCAVFGLHALRG
jgi:hypothetical protein